MGKKKTTKPEEILDDAVVEEKKPSKLDTALKEMEKKWGKGVVIGGDDKPYYEDVISTGSIGLDSALGIGGLPLGKIVEFIGWESCIDKDTYIKFLVVNPENGVVQDCKGQTIENLYKRFYNRNEHTKKSEFYVMGINENNRIMRNPIHDVVKTGVKECFRVRTEKGFELVATAEHKFYQGGFYTPLSDLRVGHTVFVHNNTTFKGRIARSDYNEDKKDDSIGNLEIIDPSAHGKLHANERQDNLRFIAVKDKITSIESVGERETYDIKCYYPHNNFVAAGIVVHNSGKSTLASHIIANAQAKGLKCLLVDGENGFDEKYASAIGVKPKDVLYVQLDENGGERAYEIASELIQSGEIQLCIVDSVNALQPKKVLLEGLSASTMGLHSRMMGQVMPQFNLVSNQNNCLCIFISQVREKIGVMFGSPETTQGGNALKFYAHMRLDIRKSVLKDGDDAYANKTRVKVIKNKMAPPFKTAEFNINFGTGIDRIDEVYKLGTSTGLIKKWGKQVTLLDNGAGGETKYELGEFQTLLKDNEEFYSCLRRDIIEKLKTTEPVEKEEEE